MIPWLKNEGPTLDELSYTKRISEMFVMGLRTTLDWTIKQKDNITQLQSPSSKSFHINEKEWQELNKKLIKLKDSGFLIIVGKNHDIKVFSTEKALLFWNDLAMELLS